MYTVKFFVMFTFKTSHSQVPLFWSLQSDLEKSGILFGVFF